MSKKKERTRLQGESWHTLKDKLTPCNYYTEENGHIKGIFKDDAGNQYIHWLNDQEIEEYRNKKDKYISGQIEFEVEDGSMTAEEFSNMFNQSLADQFKRMQNIKGKNHTTISTTVNIGTRDIERLAEKIQPVIAGGYFSKFGNTLKEIEQEAFERWKRRESNAVYGLDTGEGKDQTAWTTVKINAPVLEDVSDNIDKILGDSDLMKDINELYLRDTQEVCVRELLNRVKALQAEVQEANDNATWWHNRYKAVKKQLDELKGESDE